MNIDMAALHAILSVGELLETIKSPCRPLIDTPRAPGAHRDRPQATAEVNSVIARETDEDGNVISEWDDTPEGFGASPRPLHGRSCCKWARDAENEKTNGRVATSSPATRC